MNTAKDELTIRPYTNSDAEGVRHVCVETAPGAFNNQQMVKRLLNTYCNYYIEHEKENCFVAVNNKGDVAGYILCAADAKKWLSLFKEAYVKLEADEKDRLYMEKSTETPARFMKSYPAHLHIDILPQYQRIGLGTRLMDTLVQHLKVKGVPGLMLAVSSENIKGVNFYKKYGFNVLDQKEKEIVMAIKI